MNTMLDNKTKEKHSKRRERNHYAKVLRGDPGDLRGAFSMKIVNPKKKGPYKREKVNITNIEIDGDE